MTRRWGSLVPAREADMSLPWLKPASAGGSVDVSNVSDVSVVSVVSNVSNVAGIGRIFLTFSGWCTWLCHKRERRGGFVPVSSSVTVSQGLSCGNGRVSLSISAGWDGSVGARFIAPSSNVGNVSSSSMSISGVIDEDVLFGVMDDDALFGVIDVDVCEGEVDAINRVPTEPLPQSGISAPSSMAPRTARRMAA